MAKKKSPCATCKRVKDPDKCENKNCQEWRSWFIRRWKKYNAYFEKWGKGNG